MPWLLAVRAVSTFTAALALFLYGLRGFSRELQLVGGDTLRRGLARATSNRFAGFAVGAIATAIVQSSSAVTALTMALVDASVISLRASLGVVLGANVGTTTTAWLVSFKVVGLGPIVAGIGALLWLLPKPVAPVGKAVVFFGLIFVALDLMSAAMVPLRDDPTFVAALALASSPWLGACAGALITAVIQSSSVTSGLAILLVQQGTLDVTAAVAIILGANVGSTGTAWLASLAMNPSAQYAARCNVFFNAAGVLLLLPFVAPFAATIEARLTSPAHTVAAAHLIFNVGIALMFLGGVGPIANRYRSR